MDTTKLHAVMLTEKEIATAITGLLRIRLEGKEIPLWQNHAKPLAFKLLDELPKDSMENNVIQALTRMAISL